MSGISNYTLNQKINAVLGKTSGIPSVIDLDTTLTTGNNAGTNDIDMNNQDILNVDNIDLTTINGSAYPPVVADNTLTEVLTAGNDAGGLSITGVNDIALTTINGLNYLLGSPTAVKISNGAFAIPYELNYFSGFTKITGLGGGSTNTPSMTAISNVITFPRTGYYLITGAVQLTNPNTINPTLLGIELWNDTTNSSFSRNEGGSCTALGLGEPIIETTKIAYCTINHQMSLRAYQNYQPAGTFVTTTTNTSMSATFLAD